MLDQEHVYVGIFYACLYSFDKFMHVCL